MSRSDWHWCLDSVPDWSRTFVSESEGKRLGTDAGHWLGRFMRNRLSHPTSEGLCALLSLLPKTTATPKLTRTSNRNNLFDMFVFCIGRDLVFMHDMKSINRMGCFFTDHPVRKHMKTYTGFHLWIGLDNSKASSLL